MIDNRILAGYLTMFFERVNREPSEAALLAYRDHLNDAGLTTEEFVSAAKRLYATEDFPPPAQRFVDTVRPTPAIDTDSLLRRINKLGSYNPHTGWSAPRADKVREAFGEAVASAYSAAGGPARLLDSHSETTREIARQEFERELRAVVKARGPAALAPAPRQPLIGSGQ